MYYINKIVGWVLSPLGLLYLGLGTAWILNSRGWHKTARWCAGVLLVIVWLLGCNFMTRLVGVPLERLASGGKCAIDCESVPEADAIVLLGGGMGIHRVCGQVEMFGAADRVWVAAKLWKAGRAKVVTLSGGDVARSTVPLLEDFGVPKDACLYFKDARNTEEEAKMIRTLLDKERPRILLVTSAWHMPRAELLFKRRGFDVVTCPADCEMSYVFEEALQIRDFFPSGEALMRNSYAVKEWVGLLGYSIFRR